MGAAAVVLGQRSFAEKRARPRLSAGVGEGTPPSPKTSPREPAHAYGGFPAAGMGNVYTLSTSATVEQKEK